MHHKGLEDALWAGALAGELAFAVVAAAKGRWRRFPASCAFILFPAPDSVFFMCLAHAAPSRYGPCYMGYIGINFFLQLALILELARTVLARTPGLVRTAWKQSLTYSVLGVVVALGLALLVVPPAQTHMEQVEIRADLFTSLLTCELVITMMMTSTTLGLGWRNHVMAIGEGMLVWSTVEVIADSLHSYFGFNQYYAVPEYSANLVYIGALVYWCIQLWKEEPAPKAISPELRKYMIALHDRVHYDPR